MQAYFLSYDIPSRSDIPNPSRFLRRRAIRTQQSVWVILKDQIPYTHISTWINGGATVDVVQFDSSEGEKLLEMVAKAIRRQAQKAVRDTEAAIGRAENRMAESDKGPDAAQKQFDASVQRTVRRAESLLGDLREAASIFNLNADGLPLDTAMNAVRAIRTGASNRAKIYVEMAQEAAKLDGLGCLSEAAAADSIHPAILNDALAERGVDTQKFEEAFSG